MSFQQKILAALSHVSTLDLTDVDVSKALDNVTLDSRKVTSSSVFIAVQGHKVHGKAYIDEVLKKGVKLVIVDISASESDFVEQSNNALIVHISELSNKLTTFLTALFPQIKNLKHLIAVTGTNGKTSVASIYAQMAFAMGYKSASIGTLGVNLYDLTVEGRKYSETINTTPDIVQMFSLLAALADMQVAHVAIEASSHGIEQGRLDGLPLDTVIFTNLTQDHLDYHKSMNAYAKAKRSILNNQNIKHLVYNADDEESANWLKVVKSEVGLTGYALDNISADVTAHDIVYSSNGLRFTLNYREKAHSLALPLLGKFNIYNYLSVISVFLQQGLKLTELLRATAQIKGVNGRMELTQMANKTVLVDYAHTPDALQQALSCARQHTSGELWLVFGCGGDRDKNKRSKMGAISTQLADRIVLTEDNPRTESRDEIISDIISGMKESKLTKVEHNRAAAVRYAVSNARTGDTILLAGKGHETYIECNGKRDFYDERALVKTLAEEYA